MPSKVAEELWRTSEYDEGLWSKNITGPYEDPELLMLVVKARHNLG
jgi:hypothetical protein